MKIVPGRIGVPFLSRRRDTGSATPPPQLQTERSPNADDGGAAVRASSPNGDAGMRAIEPHAETRGSEHTSAAVYTNACSPLPIGVGGRHSHARARRPWRKLLYIKQDYPDDYVDDTFLMELQKNTNVRMYDYSTIVMQTSVVTQHISSIMVFIAVFINLYSSSLTGQLLLWSSSVSTVLGFILWDLLNMYLRTPEQRIIRLKLIKGAILFALLLFGLSPILRTLTEDTSSDTIWAMTVIFFCVNLAFHDYSTGNLTNIRFPGSVSLNAAILASVLLASQLDQLDSNLSVFAFLAFALEWFGLFPIFRRYLKRISAAASMTMAVLLALVAAVMFMFISRAVALLHLFGTLFITFVCPLWLIWVQRYKNEIHGPWDEARPIVHRYYNY
ncbi:glycosylphosphatidylinositol anchor biosynthesis [Coemansia sp. RSA 1286]|nr:glycosylphosphatidylinositol anchor biosynthesis [Coemansia sp. RSA 1286]